MLYCGGSLDSAKKHARAGIRQRNTRSHRVLCGLIGLIVVSCVLVGFVRPITLEASGPTRPALPLRTVVISQGDTLWDVAVRVAHAGDDPRQLVFEIRELNQMKSAVLRPGDVLLLPR
jgi:hypothetical protein